MNDAEFSAWIHGYCYAKQGEGYGDGTPPDGFAPIIVVFYNEDRSLNRARMMENLSISEARKAMLEKRV